MKAKCFSCGEDVDVWSSDYMLGARERLGDTVVERTRCPECGGVCYINYAKLPWWIRLAMRLGHIKGHLGLL